MRFRVFLLMISFASGPFHSRETTAAIAIDFTGEAGLSFSANATFGYRFSVTESVLVDGLGFFDDDLSNPGKLNQDHRIRLWANDPTSEPLAETTITNASTPFASAAENGRWLFNDISAIRLEPGQYVIGADDPACASGECDRIRFGNIASTDPRISFEVNLDGNSTGFPTSPNLNRNDGYFGPNLRIVSVPEPSAACSLVMAAIVTGARRRRM